jgi:hypothetical protein
LLEIQTTPDTDMLVRDELALFIHPSEVEYGEMKSRASSINRITLPFTNLQTTGLVRRSLSFHFALKALKETRRPRIICTGFPSREGSKRIVGYEF